VGSIGERTGAAIAKKTNVKTRRKPAQFCQREKK
jgi:hypothetical protein